MRVWRCCGTVVVVGAKWGRTPGLPAGHPFPPCPSVLCLPISDLHTSCARRGGKGLGRMRGVVGTREARPSLFFSFSASHAPTPPSPLPPLPARAPTLSPETARLQPYVAAAHLPLLSSPPLFLHAFAPFSRLLAGLGRSGPSFATSFLLFCVRFPAAAPSTSWFFRETAESDHGNGSACLPFSHNGRYGVRCDLRCGCFAERALDEDEIVS